jgi:type I restriction enzyme S subunit
MIKNQLGKFVTIKTGKLDANASSFDGLYPFFTCSKEPLKISTYSYDCKCVLVAGNGDLNVKYYEGKFDAYQRTYIIQSKDESILDTRYLYWFLYKYVEKLRELSIGGVIKYIKINNLTDPIIPLPPIDDQKRIVQIIDKADALCQKRKESIKSLDDYLKSVFLEMFGDPVKNPKKWPRQKFEKLGTLDRGKSKHRPRNAPELLGGEHPLIQTGDVANAELYIEKYNSTYSDIGLRQSKKWPKGTLCITIAANIAKTGILNFDACFPDSVVGFMADKNITNPVFIHFWMSFFQKILEESAPESAQKNINLRILRDLDVISPPLELQNKFSEIVQKTESIKQKMFIQSTELEAQFQSLIQKAFKGEL